MFRSFVLFIAAHYFFSGCNVFPCFWILNFEFLRYFFHRYLLFSPVYQSFVACGAPLGGSSGRQSSAITSLWIKYSPLKPKSSSSKRGFPPLSAEMLKFPTLPSSCKACVKHFVDRRTVVCPWCENLKKRRKIEREMARPWQKISERSSGSLNCLSFLTGLGIKAKSTKCQSAILICLTAFSSD